VPGNAVLSVGNLWGNIAAARTCGISVGVMAGGSGAGERRDWLLQGLQRRGQLAQLCNTGKPLPSVPANSSTPGQGCP